MTSPRNLPCPCGSGKKLKRCCGDQGTPAGPTEEDRRRAFSALSNDLLRPALDEHRARAEARFWGPWADRLDDELRGELLALPVTRIGLVCYLGIDTEVQGLGVSVIADLLERSAASLSPGVRRALADLAVARLDLYEVRGVQGGGKLDLVRVSGGHQVQVRDHAASRGLQVGRLLAARVVRRVTGELALEGDFYTYPAGMRERLLERLAGLDERERDASLFHQLWLDSALEPGVPGTGSAAGDPHVVADLRHHLDGEDLSIRIPKEARAIALYLGRIAAAASLSGREAIGTGVVCRRRPGNLPCGETVLAQLVAEDRIAWTCRGCGDSGAITGWKATPFDLRERAAVLKRGGVDAPEMRVVCLRPADLRRLLGLVHLTGPALRFLASARELGDGSIRLIGTPAELVDTARCIAVHFARCLNLSGAAADVLHELHGGLALYGEGRPDLSAAAQCAEVLLFERSRRELPSARASVDDGSHGLGGSIRPRNPGGAHRLYVRLLDIDPPIWRRLELPSRYTLEDLYHALILSFGWSDTHLHVFEQRGRRFGPPSGEWFKPVEDERAVALADVLPHAGARMVFEYDFGDSWRHTIVVEEVLTTPPERPRLVAGERASPPEDCGGPPGYERLLAILADPFHEEHESLRHRAGDHDAEAFDVEKHDERVARLEAAEGGRLHAVEREA